MDVNQYIEKRFRVRGFDEVFDTRAEAIEFLQIKVKRELKEKIATQKSFIWQGQKALIKIRKFAAEAGESNGYLRNAWTIKQDGGIYVLYSCFSDWKVKISFELDLFNAKDLRFARMLVKNYCRKEQTVIGKDIKLHKEMLKKAQKEYSNYIRSYE